ncbi:MAG: phospho-N-acetylmuramoyl-pentapeptide-transferase [Acidimicrobiales bacterium]|jgi:phospho-N-acetylmuramoyl-pentapeptide-transferase
MIRLLIAAGVALLVSLFGTRFLITWLTHRKLAQPIQEDGVQMHRETKAGTPTMGGIAIVAGIVIAYIVSDFYNGIYTRSGLLVLFAIVGSAAVGFLDDWIKVGRERNLGLRARTKFGGQIAVATTFAVLMVTLTDVHTEISFTRWDSIGIDLGPVGWCVWAVLLMVATTNGVNLTDGLDGLASGASLFAFATFTVIGFWMFGHPEIYDVGHALDLAVIAAAAVGSCAGFLWWNAAPAQIFMGDTGSLALGAGLSSLALATNTHLLLPILGALFVAETLSVIIQVAVFKRTGKRVFLIAPVHHHFEMLGWPETRVIIRLWLLAGFAASMALGIFYADFLSIPGSVG